MFSFSRASIKAILRARAYPESLKRDSSVCYCCLVHHEPFISSPSKSFAFAKSLHYITRAHRQNYRTLKPFMEAPVSSLFDFSLVRELDMLQHNSVCRKWLHVRYKSNASMELKPVGDTVRFSFNNNKQCYENGLPAEVKKGTKKVKKSRKAKRNELRFYRLKAKKKMNSPNPEVRIMYKLEKAKRKEAWLIETLRKFELPKGPAETYDPEILTEEERHYLKRTGEKKKNYVQVGRRGVFGGVVLNMHLHWKNHETVKVVCKPCQPGKIHEYAEELSRLSKGIVIDIKPNNTIIFYRGKNYVQPKDISPLNTLSKDKALKKYRYEQSLEHTGWFIEKLEKELEEYGEHVTRYKKQKVEAQRDSLENTFHGKAENRLVFTG